jgi:hypothetical protein
MGAVKKVVFEIEEAIEAGLLSLLEIAEKYDMTLEDVCLIAAELDKQYEEASMLHESMDGDFDSGMASAGFGTDEDYGYYGEE